MKRFFSDLLRALQSIAQGVHLLVDKLDGAITEPTTDPALESRLADVERRMSQHYAEAEALITKADGRFHAARAAEERARRHAESAQSDEEGDDGRDLFEELAAASAQSVPNGDVAPSPQEGVQPVHGRMGSRRATREALRARKLGL